MILDLHRGKAPAAPASRPQPVAIFEAAYRWVRPGESLPPIEVEFRPFANVNSSVRLREGRLEVRVSDLLQNAPAGVLEALAVILLSKLYRKPVPPRLRLRYRNFLNRREVRRQVHLVRQARGRKCLEAATGACYDLAKIFEDLNQRYFGGLLAMPLVSWSRSRSRVKLGHFDASHNTIVISRLLDDAGVPRCVVEYVMYHEMLHLKHPVQYGRGRRRVHSPEFLAEERRFSHYETARQALKLLC